MTNPSPVDRRGSRTHEAIRWQGEQAERFLAADDVIQTNHPHVVALGERLRADHPGDVEFARAAFEWVHDRIAHSYDAQDSRVTLTASQVLREGVGLCYAKSVLLAAILRSQGIPTGLCYQLLRDDEGHVLHGLVAVHLDGAWHRQDPRGNKPGIDAQFSLGAERLAFEVDESAGERDGSHLHATVAASVVDALGVSDDVLACALPSELPTGP